VQLRALHESLVIERFDDYSRIAEAVLAGDARRAELAARRHVRAMMDILDKVPV
jgi:DNA-binding FadR family transcriptional regulator